MALPGDSSTSRRMDLRADCEHCLGLCCVALSFSRSSEFAIDKRAGEPCPHLRQDFRCGIHDTLREGGFSGCAVFDCLGAGQKIVQVTFPGQDWREAPEVAARMFSTFEVMRQLHELAWYLSEALALDAAEPFRDELAAALEETERLTYASSDALLQLDMPVHRGRVNALLTRVSEAARAGRARRPLEYRGRAFIGKDLSDSDLRGANLRGALLVGANLRRADLAFADLTGTDLRGADLSGARLHQSLFLMQSQVTSARGDAHTSLPRQLARPMHWLR